jgi:hypothetical protein
VTELTVEEVLDMLDLMTVQRYQVDAMEFLTAWSEGKAEELFPGCHDLVILADVLDETV